MANSEVKLILTAKDDLTKTLSQVEDVINNLAKSQETLSDSSESAQKSMGDLRAELAKLEAVRKTLLGQQNQLDRFEQESRASAELADKLEDQRKALEKLNDEKAQAESNLDEQKKAVEAAREAAKAAQDEAKEAEKAANSRSEASKAVTEYRNSVSGLAEALEKNSEATDEDRKALEAQRVELEKAQAVLTERKALADRLAAQAKERKAALDEELAKEKELAGALKAQSRAASEQEKENIKLTESLAKKNAAVERSAEKLKSFGIATDNISDAQQRLIRVAQQVRTGLDAVGNEISNFDGSARAAQQSAIRLAQDAQRAADRLGKASVDKSFADAAKPIQSVAQSIREIIDPSTKAYQSVDALAASVEEFGKATSGNTFGSAEEQISSLQDAIQGLRRAQEAALGQSKAIDKYRSQQAAVDALATSLNRAEARVRELSAAVAASDGPNEALNAELRDARRELEAVSNSYRQAGTTLESYKAKLETVGISVSGMAAAQQKLSAAAASSVASIRTATGKLDELRSANVQAAQSFELIPRSGRQALDLFQRIRGEVLATIGAYVGLFAAVDNVKKAVEVTRTIQGVQARLAVITDGNIEQTTALYGQLRAEADRLGLSFEKLSTQYSKLAIAGKASGFAQEQVNYIFSSFNEAAAKLRLDGEQVEGVFYAIEQIISKGAVNTEELRQQLGERLPGAFSTFAAALKEPNETLDEATNRVIKLLEQGKITSQALIPLATKLRETYQNSDADLQTLDKQIQRFQNVLMDLRSYFANEDFQKRLSDLIQRLTEVFQSNNFAKGVDALRDAFFAIGEAVVWVVENLDALKVILTALIAGGTARYVTSMVLGFKEWAAAARNAAIATGILNTATAGLLGKAGFLGILYLIIDKLVEMSDAGKKAAIYLGSEFVKAGTAIKAMWDQAPVYARIAFNSIREIVVKIATEIAKNLTDNILVPLKKIAELAGLDKLSSSIEAIQARIGEAGFGLAQAAVNDRVAAEAELDALQKDFDRTMTEISDNVAKAMAQVDRDTQFGKEKAFSIPTQGLNIEGGDVPSGPIFRDGQDSGKAAKKAKDEAKDLRDEIAKIIAETERKIAEESASTLEDRLALIADDYKELYVQINSAFESGAIDADMAQRANLLVGQLTVIRQEKERQIYATEQLAEAEKKLNDLMAERDAKIDSINVRLADGRLNQFQAAIAIDEITGQYRDKLIEAAEAAKQLSDNLGDTVKSEQLKTKIEEVKGSVDELGAGFNRDIAQGGAEAIGTLGEGLGKVIAGTGTLSEAFKSAGDAFRSFAADFLRRIAQMILQQAILNAIGGASGGGIGRILADGVRAVVAHEGALVGHSGGKRRFVDPAIFAGAPRFHSGGMPGLKQNEVPAILQKGEEVLTKNDPRNALNGGANQNSTQVKIINTIDSGSVVSQGVNTAGGQKAIVNAIRANKSTIKSLLA